MPEQKRYVVSASIDGKEIMRRAVWATELPTKEDVFTDDEFKLLTAAMQISTIILTVTETP